MNSPLLSVFILFIEKPAPRVVIRRRFVYANETDRRPSIRSNEHRWDRRAEVNPAVVRRDKLRRGDLRTPSHRCPISSKTDGPSTGQSSKLRLCILVTSRTSTIPPLSYKHTHTNTYTYTIGGQPPRFCRRLSSTFIRARGFAVLDTRLFFRRQFAPYV